MPLPWNLAIDPVTGVLSGVPFAQPGTYSVTVKAMNVNGEDVVTFPLVLNDSPTNPYVCVQNLGVLRSFLLNGGQGARDYINVSDPVLTLKGNGGLCSYRVSVDGVELPDVYRCNVYASVCIHLHGLAEGVHTISAVEIAPQAGAVAGPYSFTVDTVLPPAPVITEAFFSLSTVVVKGTSVPEVVSVLAYEGALQLGGAGPNAGSWTVAINGMSSGVHTLFARGVDLAGNKSAPSNSMVVTVP